MSERPRWEDLRIFLNVARANGLTAASRVLKMDPATLGRRIARLEEDLGTPLFVKSPQGYALSDAGLRLLPHAEAMEQAARSLRGALGDQAEGLTGNLRIGAPDGCANYVLAPVCAAICDEHPGLDIQIVAMPRVLNISKREVDMAIAVSPPRTGRLSVQRISDYHLHLAASQDYLASHAPIRRKRDLRDHRLIGYIGDLIFDDELNFMDQVGEGVSASLSSNSVPVQLNLANAGAGVCITHDFALPFFPKLKKVIPDQFTLKRSFYLVRHTGDRRVERLNRIAALLSNEMRQEINRLEGLT